MSSAPPPASGVRAASSPAEESRARLVVLTLCLGGLVTALTQTLVIPIQGDLPGLLHASAADTAWVITVTLLASAVTMPLAGRLADLHGKRPVLLATASAVVLGSVVCALSDSLAQVLVGRALQGVGIGFIPVGISLLRAVVPPHLAGSAVAAMSATMGVGGAVGLPLSAWIATVADWHALFWFGAACAAAVVVLTWRTVPHLPDAPGGRLDGLGAVGLSVALVSLLVGVSKGTTWGWGSPRTLGALGLGAAVLLVWGRYELRQDAPLVDLRTTAKRPVLVTDLAAVAVGFGMMAQSVVVPQLFQMPTATGYGLGQSLLATGLWLGPGGLMMMVFAPVSSRLIARVGGRLTLMLGAVVLGCGYLVGALFLHHPWQLLLVSCITSAGVGIGYAAMPTLVLDAVPAGEAAAALGLNALSRSLGMTVAAAVMGTVLTSSTRAFGPSVVPTERAFHLCFIIGAVAAFVAAAVTATLPRHVQADVAPLLPAAPALQEAPVG